MSSEQNASLILLPSTKRMTRYTPLLQGKAQSCAVRDKQDPLSYSNERKNELVSRLRKGREKTRHSFLSQTICLQSEAIASVGFLCALISVQRGRIQLLLLLFPYRTVAPASLHRRTALPVHGRFFYLTD